MKTLLVLRHAKSDWSADYGADHDRPLNRRGLASAHHVGELVRDLDLIPDLIISSTAVRARTTVEIAIEAGQWGSVLTLDERLYHSGPDSVLKIISASDPTDRVMVVGHQPTWGSLVYQMTGVPTEIKTATLAVIDLMITTWDQVIDSTGRLASVHHPPHES